MKNIRTLLFISALFILTAESCAQKTVEGVPVSLVDSASYAMGVDLGGRLAGAQLDTFSIDIVMSELTGIFKGQEPKFDREQAQNIFFAHIMNIRAVMQDTAAVKEMMDNMPQMQKDSLATAFAVVFGEDLKNAKFDILDSAIMSQAMKETMGGKEPRYDNMVMQGVVQNFMAKREAYAADKSKDAGKKFLKANKKEVDVVELPSGLQYKVIIEGSGAKPVASDNVKVHYRGTLIDGREFDSSYKRGEPVEFRLDGVIKGWTEGLQLMSEGSKYMFYIPSDLAYGDRSMPGTIITGGATLIFEVELLEVNPAEEEILMEEEGI